MNEKQFTLNDLRNAFVAGEVFEANTIAVEMCIIDELTEPDFGEWVKDTFDIDVDNLPPSKDEKIKQIKEIIERWGNVSGIDLQLDSSPCLSSLGNKNNVSVLVEEYYSDHVSAITYHDDVEVGWNDYDYDNLSNDIIDEILINMKLYDTIEKSK